MVYVKHPAVSRLGSVSLQLPKGWSKGMTSQDRRDYDLEVAFQFGQVEIRVTLTNTQTGEAVQTTVNYE